MLILKEKLIPRETTVAVLVGGWSAERKVSLSTGEGCAAALRRAGFNTIMVDVKRETIHSVLLDMKPHIAFNALHGKWGEDGGASATLETLGIPYTHSGVLASALAMHKEKSKIVFRDAGIAVAESKIVPVEQVAAGHPMPPPYVVKPVSEGSSLGVHIVQASSNGPVTQVLDERQLFGTHAMVEKFIPGRELTCAVMGDVALGVIEIEANLGTFYGYEAKYEQGGSRHTVPADVPRDIYRKCQLISLKAHEAVGCRGVSRCDFRYNDTPGGDGEIYLLEINTHPGMTGTSLVPELAKHAGHSFEDLVTWMVNDASLDR